MCVFVCVWGGLGQRRTKFLMDATGSGLKRARCVFIVHVPSAVLNVLFRSSVPDRDASRYFRRREAELSPDFSFAHIISCFSPTFVLPCFGRQLHSKNSTPFLVAVVSNLPM